MIEFGINLNTQMTNGMVEPSRYQTSSSASMMGYDYHQDGGSLSGVFDAAFSAAAATSRRGYVPASYDGGMMPPSAAMHQVDKNLWRYFRSSLSSSFSCVSIECSSFSPLRYPTGSRLSDGERWWDAWKSDENM